jgi:hypothetical protein
VGHSGPRNRWAGAPGRTEARQHHERTEPGRKYRHRHPGAPADYEPLRHAYIRKQLRLIAEGKLRVAPGARQHVEVRHDDRCALLVQGGYCDCDPDIRVRKED